VGLSNPYSHPPRPSGRDRLRRVVTIGGAAVGITVMAGCSGAAQPTPPAPLPGTAAPPTMPLPTGPPPASQLDALTTPPPPAAAPSTTESAAPEQAGVPAQRPVGPPQLVNDGGDYRVVRGDTLSGIAARFDVDGGWPRIWARNCDVLYDPDFILPGQELDLDGPVVPGCGS
jgi:nucleoid-associated protein YgaU